MLFIDTFRFVPELGNLEAEGFYALSYPGTLLPTRFKFIDLRFTCYWPPAWVAVLYETRDRLALWLTAAEAGPTTRDFWFA